MRTLSRHPTAVDAAELPVGVLQIDRYDAHHPDDMALRQPELHTWIWSLDDSDAATAQRHGARHASYFTSSCALLRCL